MRVGARPGRRLSRACGCLAVALVVLLIVLGVLASRALAAPDLGGPPRGPDDGSSQAAIAAHLAPELATQLVARPHAVVTLSEHDLTVLVRENNPNPGRYQDPQVRVRDGLVVLDARTPAGPFTVTAVGKVALALGTGSDGAPTIDATLRAIQIGALGLPDVFSRGIEERIQQSLDLHDLLASDSRLVLLRSALECVAVVADGVRLGFHRPGTPADTGTCR